MGLDQYLYAYATEDSERREVGRWRKHANLQGFMEQKWRELHPDTDEDFNCVPLRLTKDICEEVIERSRARTLPYTVGFFFGTSMPEDDEDTIRLMQEAIRLIEAGEIVEYDSWW